ncbi:MAG: hypothetical protein BMS9Abin07_1731 [Acidimicrobiia bacterium]|nr:MAG: hypothetical protein BMS9Abin07_1731 [Acidimicrobiia bacterium]
MPLVFDLDELELTQAIRLAGDSACASENITLDILADLGDRDLDVQSMGLFLETASGSNIVLDATLATTVAGTWWPFTESADDRAEIHAKLFFNHARTSASMASTFSEDFFVAVLGNSDIEGADYKDVFAYWDALDIVYVNPTDLEASETREFGAFALLRSDDAEVVLSETSLSIGWDRIDAWVGEIDGYLVAVGPGEPSTSIDPRWSKELVPLLCAVLSTEYANAADRTGDIESHQTLLNRLMASQELLLLTEYLEVISLSQTEVESASVGPSEYVEFWQRAGLNTIDSYRLWMDEMPGADSGYSA